MAKKQKAFRLDANTITELENLAKEWNTNQTEALERAIHFSYESYLSNANSNTSYTKSDTAKNDFEDPQFLKNQLAVKDEQIAGLNKALANAQEQSQIQIETLAKQTETLNQALLNAQALNGMDKAPTALLDQPRPSRWSRFKRWVTGKDGTADSE